MLRDVCTWILVCALNAMQGVPAGTSQGLTEARTAIYLIASSSQYQVYR
jgi:hypothetical protein